jgi:hypothetical protein
MRITHSTAAKRATRTARTTGTGAPSLELVALLVALTVDKFARSAQRDVPLGIRAGARIDSRVSHDIDPPLAAEVLISCRF